ncbi:MAG: division/cell wall cluster transcriptional repressor MraZ [Planctomycetota bacterium]
MRPDTREHLVPGIMGNPTYSGTSEHSLDDKGRLILPGRILDKLPKEEWKFHLSAGLDRCLLVHDLAGWQVLAQRLGGGVPGSRAHRALCRRFLGHSEEVVPDNSRRIRIPDPLMKYAGLAPSGQAVLIGSGRVLEIWAPSVLDSTLAEATPEEEELFANLVGPSTAPASQGT